MSASAISACPQCGQGLEVYHPDAEELDAMEAEAGGGEPQPEARTMALSPLDLPPLDDLHRHPQGEGILASGSMTSGATRRRTERPPEPDIDGPTLAFRPGPLPAPAPQLEPTMPPMPAPELPAPDPLPPTPPSTAKLPEPELPPPPAPAPKKKNPFMRGPLEMPGDAPKAPDPSDGPRKTRVMDAISDEQLAAPDFDAPRPSRPSPPAPEAPGPQGPRSQGKSSSTRVMEALDGDALDGGSPEAPMPFTDTMLPQVPLTPQPEVDAVPSAPTPGAPTRRAPKASKGPSPRPRGAGGRPRWLVPVIAGVAIVGVGIGVWIAVSGEDPSPPPERPDAVEPEVSWPRSFESALGEMAVSLPVTRSGEGVQERPYIIASSEGLITSAGAVPGLPTASAKAVAHNLESDADGEWLRGIDAQMKSAGQASGVALLALDQALDARTVARVGRSFIKAGFDGLALVVRREGQVALLPFELRSERDPIPSGGAVVVYVGQRQARVTVQDASGRTAVRSPESLEVKGSGELDMAALDAQIAALGEPAASLDQIVIRCVGDIQLSRLAALMDRVRTQGGGRRFASLSLAVR